MPARIILQVQKGNLVGQEFVFEERTTCIIGRAKDCEPKIPTDLEHRTVSRHHCLLDINPPDIRIRDFGSLNGTYVNGRKIGQREQHQKPEEATATQFPEYDLKDGDEIGLGATVIRVGVYVPAFCTDCAAEIPEDQQAAATRQAGGPLCPTCRKRARQLASTESIKRPRQGAPPDRKTVVEKIRVCAKCGRDVSAEVGPSRQGEYICAACRTDPFALLKHLLREADTGERDLAAIEGYEVLQELGRGGTGAVYLARDPRLGRQVALKVMLPQVAANQAATEKFLREIENTKALRHPHVVQIYDSGCSHGTFFFTLEYCDGGSVDQLMHGRGGKLPVDEALGIMLQILDGLAYAHQAEIPCVRLEDGKIGRGRGLVHRDLKPHNIFLAAAGNSRVAKVGDYGLAKAFDLAGLSGHTCTGTVAGTPHFMPRQQVLRFRFAKPEVDVWAAAASLYFLLTGCAPRDFTAGMDPWQTVLQTKPVPIRRRAPAVPKRLAAVIDHALVDDPEIPFKSAAEFRRALEGAL